MKVDVIAGIELLNLAIDDAATALKNLESVKAERLSEDDYIKAHTALLESKISIRDSLESAAKIASGEENNEVRNQILSQIDDLNRTIGKINEEIRNLTAVRDDKMAALTEKKESLSRDYLGAIKLVETRYAEYHELLNEFDDELNEIMLKLKKKATEENEATTDNASEPATDESENPENDEPAFDDDVICDEVPDALPGLLSIMQKFDEEVCGYDLIRDPMGDYDAELEKLWLRIVPNDDEKKAIFDIVRAGNIKYLSTNQTRQLANSLPVKLLKLCDNPAGDLRAFIEARENYQDDYYGKGMLNEWRPKFTYQVIKQLCDHCATSIADEDFFSEIDFSEIDMIFFNDNTDCIKKRWIFEERVVKAFAKTGNYRDR